MEHLTQRKETGIYYFRARTPVKLAPIIGKAFLRISLKTPDEKIAKQRALPATKLINSLRLISKMELTAMVSASLIAQKAYRSNYLQNLCGV